MNLKHGIVKKIEDNYAFIFTEDNELIKVEIGEKLPYIGQEYCGKQVNINNSATHSVFFKLAISLAIIVILFLPCKYIYNYFTPVTTISIDLNCSISLKINKWDKIISSSSLDNNGTLLLKSTSLKNKNVNSALILLFNEAQKHNYINDSFTKSGKKLYFLITTKKSFIDISKFENTIKNKTFNIQITKNGATVLNTSSKY